MVGYSSKEWKVYKPLQPSENYSQIQNKWKSFQSEWKSLQKE